MKENNLWDEFLNRWSITAMKELTLEQYIGIDNKDTFAYWLEHKTSSLGSIKGGDSSKFGIYLRKKAPEGNKTHVLHGERYTWVKRFGDTEDKAFRNIKSLMLAVVSSIQKGDTKAIEDIKLADTLKWKIAFLYQSKISPCVINIFTKDMLSTLAEPSTNFSFSSVHQKLMEGRENQDVLDYGSTLWAKVAEIKKQKDIVSMLDKFKSRNDFIEVSKGWGNEYIQGFCELVNFCHKNKLDVFYTKMTAGGYIRVGRREKSDLKAQSLVLGIKPLAKSFQLKIREEGDTLEWVNFDTNTLNDFKKKSAFLSQFVQDFPLIKRKAYWPCDYEYDAIEDVTVHEKQVQDKPSSMLNQILYGPPGTGKTYNTVHRSLSIICPDELSKNSSYEDKKAVFEEACQRGQIKFVTFHQSYGYEEFVEGIKPKTTDNEQIIYQLEDGVFKKLCRQAEQNPTLPYIFIIDEINRGNISKIFGELITLIEPAKRSGVGQLEAISLVLSSSGEEFSVPSNVHLIGTMNTADRSLTMMDTALRRRFDFIEMMPKPSLLSNITINGIDIDLKELLRIVNERIEVLFDREHTLGHAFFIPCMNAFKNQGEQAALTELKVAFKNKIIPLLEEYFFEDWYKIQLVLGDNQKKFKELNFVEKVTINNETLFGAEYANSQHDQVNESYILKGFSDEVWSNPDAYQQIYMTTKNLKEQVS